MKSWIIAAACCTVASAWAGPTCEGLRTEFDTMACLHRIYHFLTTIHRITTGENAFDTGGAVIHRYFKC